MPQIPDHPYRILITGGCESGKTISLFNLISQQPDINKTSSYAKDSYEAKHQFLTNKRKKCVNWMIIRLLLNTQMIWMLFTKNIEKKKIQIKNVWFLFDLIAEILSHKKLNVIANESFIRDIKIFNLERI